MASPTEPIMGNLALATPKKNLTVLKASAGSGKTYNLAKIYIDYLLWDSSGKLRTGGGHYHEHILAITFTNKATQEMKSRIVRELHALAQGGGDYMSQFVAAHGTPAADIRKAAARALAGILFGYTNFNVNTIDSFFQLVLRNFAHELDVDYNYEVQLESDYAIRQSVSSFLHDLSAAGSGKDYSRETKWLKEFVQAQVRYNQSDSGVDWNVFGRKNRNSLIKLAGKINDDDYRALADDMAAYLDTEGLANFTQLMVRMRDISCIYYCGAVPDKLKEAYGEKITDIPTSPERFGELIAGLECCSKPLLGLSKPRSADENINDTLLKYTYDDIATPTQTLRNGSEKSKCFKNLQDIPQERLQKIYEFKCLVVGAYKLWKMFDRSLGLLWQLGMLSSVNSKLQEFRRDNDVILLSDTNELIGRVLDSGTPFVYERVGMWLNHFMIDEFQDTSRAQYANFKPLLSDSLTAGHGNLIIGDEKQSIYRFRDSDPQLLHEQIGEDFARDYDDSLKLNTNYRSTDSVIDFNNRLFKAIVDAFTRGGNMRRLAGTYANLHQQHNTSRKLHPLGSDRPAGLVRVHIYEGDVTRGDVKRKDSEHVLHILPYYLLELHERHGFSFGDMLILVNKRSEGDEVVERLLRWNMAHSADRFIGVMSEESLKLVNSPAVQLVVSVLRFIDATQYALPDGDDNPEPAAGDDPDAARAHNKRLSEQLRYEVLHLFDRKVAQEHPSSAVEAGRLLQACFDEMRDQLEGLTPEQKDAHYAQSLAYVLPEKGEMASLVGMVDKIIAAYGINADGQNTPFLLEFQNKVIEFAGQASSGGTVHEFLRYWDQNKSKFTIPATDSDNAVRVMTIHKSKGLEAPCVIIPFASWEMIKKDGMKVRWLTGEQFAGLAALSGLLPEMRQISDKQACIPPLVPVSDKYAFEAVTLMSGLLDGDFPLGNYIAAQAEDDVIDSLNKTYVAFTRPCQQLHVFCPKAKHDAINPLSTSIASVLDVLLPGLEGVVAEEVDDFSEDSEGYCDDDYYNDETGYFIGSTCSYHLGDPAAWRLGDAGDEATTTGEQFCDYVVNSGLISKLEVKLPDVATSNESEGTNLHRVVSLLITVADRDRALVYARQRHFAQQQSYWTEERIEQLIDHLLTSPDTAQWFQKGNRVYSERPLLRFEHGGEKTQTYRPDRVVATPDGRTLVIDYKFGASSDPALMKRYERQVSRYAQLLAQAGMSGVEAYLYMAREERVVPVSWQQ